MTSQETDNSPADPPSSRKNAGDSLLIGVQLFHLLKGGMDTTDYLKIRLDDQIRWYDLKSQRNRSWYLWLRSTEIALASSIPVLSAISTPSISWMNLVIATFGGSVAAIAGLLALFKFQENWIEYRTTCETLKHEKMAFLTKASPYDTGEAFQDLVRRVESIISRENSNWLVTQSFSASPART